MHTRPGENTHAAAAAFLTHCDKPMRIVLGDDELIWVTTVAEATRLERKGYTVL
jgi:hypothetical protein